MKREILNAKREIKCETKREMTCEPRRKEKKKKKTGVTERRENGEGKMGYLIRGSWDLGRTVAFLLLLSDESYD
jgi:hypothetical protein